MYGILLPDLLKSNVADMNVVTVRSRLPIRGHWSNMLPHMEVRHQHICVIAMTSQLRLRQHRRIVHDCIVLPCDVRGCLFTGSAKECTSVHYQNTQKKCINHKLVHVELVMPPSPLLHCLMSIQKVRMGCIMYVTFVVGYLSGGHL